MSDTQRFSEEQNLAIATTNQNVLVSASAGSGKTTVMLERVCKQISNGIDIEKIVMLSFNNDIAEEIKAKLAGKLLAEASKEGADVAYFQRQIDAIPFANIATFHGFCSNLIRQYADAAGLPPSFMILHGEEQKTVFSEAINKVFSDYTRAYDKDFFLLRKMFAVVNDGGLAERVTQLYNMTMAQPERDKWLKNTATVNYDDTTFVKESLLCEIRERFLTLGEEAEKFLKYIDGNEKTDIAMRKHLAEIIARTKQICTKKSLKEIALLIEERLPNRPAIKEHALSDDFLELAEYSKEVFKDYAFLKQIDLDCKKSADAARTIQKLAEMVTRVDCEYSREKIKDGKLDFNDLEHYALKILKIDDIAFEVGQSFDFVCVDEYQDTNFVQEYIINRIGKNNNLFMVGDSKQSIYKFRMTEPKIIIDKYDEYKSIGGGQAINLNRNYRSRKEILKFVNMVFDVIMTKNNGGLDYSKTARFLEEDFYQEVSEIAAVEFLQVAKDDELPDDIAADIYSQNTHKNSSDKDSEKFSARCIAQKILQLVGVQNIFDVKTGQTRSIRYSDIVLLAESRSEKVAAIIGELQCLNIPILAEGIKKAENIYEVDLIIDLLRLIDNEQQDLPLVAVCTSFFGEFTTEEMAIIAAENRTDYFFKSFYNYQKDNDIKKKINRFVDKIAQLREIASFKSTSETILYVLKNTGFEEYLLSRENGRILCSCVENFLQSINTKSYGASVNDFVHSIDNLNAEEIGVAKSESLVDCVGTSTIHSSKGLEYPVVFLIDIDKRFRFDEVKNGMIMHGEHGVFVRDFNHEKLVYADNMPFVFAKRIKRKEEIEEKVRLLYVALTRAKNHLFIVGNEVSHNKRRGYNFSSFAEMLQKVKTQNSQFDQYCTVCNKEDFVTAQQKIIGVDSQLRRDVLDEISKIAQYKYPHQDTAKLAQKYTVSQINAQVTDDEQPVAEWLFSGEKAETGTNYHKIMQYVDFDCADETALDNCFAEMMMRGILNEKEILSIDKKVVLNALQSDIIKTARQKRFLREQEFLMYLPSIKVIEGGGQDKVLIQGAIDLVIIDDVKKSCVVVDFKLSNKPKELLIKTYKKQLMLYASAVGEATGYMIEKCVLYVLGRGEEIEILST